MLGGFPVKSPGTWPFWPFSLAAALFTRDTGVQLCKSEHARTGEKERVEKKQAGDVFFHGHPLSACSARPPVEGATGQQLQAQAKRAV